MGIGWGYIQSIKKVIICSCDNFLIPLFVVIFCFLFFGQKEKRPPDGACKRSGELSRVTQQKRPLSQAVFPLLFTSGYIGSGVVAHPAPFTIHSCSSSSPSSLLAYIDPISWFSTLIYLQIFTKNAILRFAKIAIFARDVPYRYKKLSCISKN